MNTYTTINTNTISQADPAAMQALHERLCDRPDGWNPETGRKKAKAGRQKEKPTIWVGPMLYTVQNIPDKSWDKEKREQNTLYKSGDLLIDPYARQVYKAGQALDVTPSEFEIILYLVGNAFISCAKESLKYVLSLRYRGRVSDTTLTSHIYRMRHKLGCNGHCYIVTQHCIGYKWNMPVVRLYIDREAAQTL